jgi:hypothetical protein
MSDPSLQKLVEIEGFKDDLSLLEAAVTDSVCPAICMNEGRDYTAEMEPDQSQGWCEVCNANSLKSALVLANLI